MIIFTVLLTILLALAIVAMCFLTVGGAAFIAVFGDLVVCALLIYVIVKIIKKIRKK